MKVHSITAAVLLAGATAWGNSAQAVTGTCSQGNVGYSLSSVAANDANNVFCSTGNDTNTITAGFSLFGMTGWILADKSDEVTGTQNITFSNAPIALESPADWAITDPAGIASDVVITLKQGSSFAAFLVDSTSGTWGTTGPGQGARNDLSHGSIYYQPGSSAPIPLPAGLPLLLSGLAAAGLLARRRKTA